MLRRTAVLTVAALALACAASAADRNWAAAEIEAVTQAGVLGASPATFSPQSALTQSALAAAIEATDGLRHEAAAPTAKAGPPVVLSNLTPDATLAGEATIEIQADRDVDHVAFALDGTGVHTEEQEPYELDLDVSSLADGPHTLAVQVVYAGGGYAISVVPFAVANGSDASLGSDLAPLPLAKSRLPAATAAPARTLYRALAPSKAVTMKQLDAALVGYLGLGDAARKIQSTLRAAGLNPPANTGTEAVARMLGLRLNHPAGEDDLELLPSHAATRAEAAYSFAQVLRLESWTVDSVRTAADAFTLPALSPWQQRVLTTAIHYVGYPYVWGGTSPTRETFGNVTAAGGFDCSGFVWRVYKLTPYAGAGALATVLRGRTTYQMSGEVSGAKRIPAAQLQPGDVMFFGAHGRSSRPSEVDHAGLYLGNGWFVQSSGEGVTLLPFGGWYTRSFAWGRRPLREAGLSG